MLLTIWAGIGYYSVIFLAGLQNIPEELYDAARIDGCNDFQKHWHVTLPGLRPQIVFVAVISSLAALKVFDEIYILTGKTGGILDCGTTMVFYLWKQAFVLQHAGYAAAIAIVLLVDHARLLDRQRPAPRRRDADDDGPSSPEPGRAARPSAPPRRRRSSPGRDPTGRRARAPAGGARRERGLVRDPDVLRRHHGLPIPVDAADVAQGRRRPDRVGAAAVHPGPPDARQLRAGARSGCRS